MLLRFVNMNLLNRVKQIGNPEINLNPSEILKNKSIRSAVCAVAGLVASGVIIFGGNNTSAIAENVVGSEQIVKDNPELILLETPKLKTKNTKTKIATLYPDGSSDLNYDIEKNSAGELVPIVPAENDAEYIVNNASDKEMDK